MNSVLTEEGLNADTEMSHEKNLTETKSYGGNFILPSRYLGRLTK